MNAALPPSLPPSPAHRRPLFLAGCAAGCLGIFLVFLLGAVLLVLAALELPPFDPKLPRGALPVPPEYVGAWQAIDDPSSTLTIHKDGKGDCDIHHRGGAYRMLGGRIHYDPARRLLSLKFLIFGPSWHVDEPPHPAAHGLEMKLNGHPYRRIGNATGPSGIQIHFLPDGTAPDPRPDAARSGQEAREPSTASASPHARRPSSFRISIQGSTPKPTTATNSKKSS